MTTPENMEIQEAQTPPQETEPSGEVSESTADLEEPMAQETEPVEEEIEEAPPMISHYIIDPTRTEELERSLNVMLMSRRCSSCKDRLTASQEKPSVEEHIKQIVECCSGQEGFIRPEMPMQEIVFRSILAEKNQPIKLEVLHDLVTDKWYTPINPRNLSVAGLKRVLDNDVYYGFKEVPCLQRRANRPPGRDRTY